MSRSDDGSDGSGGDDEVPYKEQQLSKAEWVALKTRATYTQRNGVWQYAWFDASSTFGKDSVLELTIKCINGSRFAASAVVKQCREPMRHYTGADGYKIALGLIPRHQ
jgi:hypothetical protein